VGAIRPDSQAGRSGGFAVHDRLVALNGYPVTSYASFKEALAAVAIGAKVAIEIAPAAVAAIEDATPAGSAAGGAAGGTTDSLVAGRPLREEEAELTAAAPDDNSQEAELSSPAKAELLRLALQAEVVDEGIASSLVCPITNELMTDPVFTLDGQVSPTHTHTYTQTLTMTHAQTLPLTLTLTSTLPLPLTRRTSARLSRRGCATTTPRPPPASRCHPRSLSPTCARGACCASCPS